MFCGPASRCCGVRHIYPRLLFLLVFKEYCVLGFVKREDPSLAILSIVSASLTVPCSCIMRCLACNCDLSTCCRWDAKPKHAGRQAEESLSALGYSDRRARHNSPSGRSLAGSSHALQIARYLESSNDYLNQIVDASVAIIALYSYECHSSVTV